MGIFKNKKGEPSKLAGILKGVLQNPTFRTLVPGGNWIAAGVGVLVPDKKVRLEASGLSDAKLEAVKEISNPILKDIIQAIVILAPIIYGIIELVKS